MNIAIIGPGLAGKDTVGQMLQKYTPLIYAGSVSWFATPVVATAMKVAQQIAWDQRKDNRKMWRETIDKYRKNDPTMFIRLALEHGQIVTGIRSKTEFVAAIKAGFIDKSIWVERPGIPRDVTLDIMPSDCDYHIANTDDLEDLQWKVEALAKMFK